MYNAVCVWCLTCLMALPLTSVYAQEEVVRLDANESPPFWSLKLPYDGMCGEIVHAASEQAGLISYVQFKPLKRLIEDDANNDLGNPQFYMENQDFAAIVPIALYNSALFYYQPDGAETKRFTGLNDLKGYKIGILKGTLAEASRFQNAGLHFEESYSQASLFKKLRLGRVDVVIEINLLGLNMIQQLFPEEVDHFHAEVIPGSAAPIAILMAEEYPGAMTIGHKYRQGLQAIIDSGRYQQILEKYYGEGGIPADWFEQLQRFDRLYNFQGVE